MQRAARAAAVPFSRHPLDLAGKADGQPGGPGRTFRSKSASALSNRKFFSSETQEPTAAT